MRERLGESKTYVHSHILYRTSKSPEKLGGYVISISKFVVL